ncbi:hypothetical protein [Emticicia sp. 21SJ11W-3]|uniref:hypothetical protein n=1 Tax=Emticicia sp. 21SJ11W-3 TaxID=2916755 RepID=UPI00209D6E73|nr:hypothetical protein [Emticicia sp. 21SJ11W-3]UTA68749.1 hypothetical protein MB380_02845 [Emticicia sp. 21SJ11W-3]
MKKNLGLFDMALALSVDKINAQFEQLMMFNVIPTHWCFLTDKEGKQIINETDAFGTNIKLWKSAFDLETATKIQQLKADIKSEKAKEKPDKDKLSKLRDKLEDMEEVIDKRAVYKVYDCALEAKVRSFEIDIIDNDSARLFFIVNLEMGTIYSREYDDKLKAETIIEKDFKNLSYAFRVAIGNRVIKAKEMAMGVEDRQLLIKEGITDDVFTIEALFMDFQNANISDYDEQRSNEINKGGSAWLQLIMNNYFKSLKTEENPYILGYKLIPKKTLTDSLFKPTGITYSTTNSSIGGCKSFNFMMQIDNHAFPAELTRGSLPKSLIENRADASRETVNGVFAIDYKTFVKKYVEDNLWPAMVANFKSNLSRTLEGYHINDWGNRRGVKCVGGDTWFDFRLDLSSIQQVSAQRQEARGLEINFDVVIEGNKHVEKENKLIGLINLGSTIGVDMPFSTSGAYAIEGKVGKKGKVSVILTASADGKIDLKSKYEAPQIGADVEKPQYKDGWDKAFDIFLDFFNPLGVLGAVIIAALKEGSLKIKLSNAIFSNIDISNLSTFNSRIVLPGSNTFTYKTIRLLTGKKDEDDAVLFDIAYAPKAQ